MNQQYSIQMYLSSLIEIEQEMQKELALRQRMTGDALILIRLIISQECCTCISDARILSKSGAKCRKYRQNFDLRHYVKYTVYFGAPILITTV
jgi:hypothetical protein